MSNKEVILMLYPTRAEATMGFDRVFTTIKDPKISVRKSDMIETEKVRMHFMTISVHYYAWIKGCLYDKVWIDERVNTAPDVEYGITLQQLINSRKR